MARTGHQNLSPTGFLNWVLLWVLLLSLAFPAPPAHAGGELQVDGWGENDGLPQGTVTSFARDPDGYLWVGTFAGLYRFSGTHFEEQVAPPEIYAQLARITAMVPDPEHQGAWLGVEGGGVWRVHDGHFEAIEQPDALRSATVWDFEWLPTQSPGDAVLVVAASAGVWRYGQRTGWERLSTDPALTIEPVDERTLWAGNHVALWRISDGVSEPPVLTGSFHGMWADPDGDVWVASSTGPLIVADAGVPRAVADWSARLPLGVDPVRDAQGQVWLGTSDGLVRLGPWAEVKAHILAGRPLSPVAVPLDSAPRALHVDRDGTLWVGTTTAGLRRVTERPFDHIAAPEGVQVYSTGPLARGADQTWLSFNCAQLFAFDGTAWTASVDVADAPGDTQGSRCVHALAADDQGGLYIGYSGYVWRYQDGTWHAVSVADGGLVPAETPTMLQLDASGHLWVGTSEGRLFHGDARQPSPLARVAFPEAARRVLSLAEVDDTRLVVGTIDGAWVRDAGVWHQRTCADGFACGPVRDLTVDPQNTVWAATYGGGLGWLEGTRSGRITPAEHGLPDGFLSSLAVGDTGALWMHGNRGLYEVALSDLRAAQQPDADPLLSHRVDVGEANGWARPSSALQADATLWLVTVNGLVRYALDTRRETSEPSRVRIVSMRVGAVTVDLDRHDLMLDAELGRTIELTFSTPVLRPDQVARYQYRLVSHGGGSGSEGFSVPTRRSSVVLAALEPGPHTFEVRSVGAAGAVGPISQLRFEVRRAWYEHPAVPVFVAVLVAFVIGALVWGRLRAAEARTRALTLAVHEHQAVEDRLERQRRFYRQVFDTAGISLLLFDGTGKCLEVNREACTLFRVERATLLGWTPAHLGLESGHAAGTAGRCRRPDGTTFAARVVSASFVSDDQRYFLVSVADLSGLLATRAQAEERRRLGQQQQDAAALGRYVHTRLEGLRAALATLRAAASQEVPATDALTTSVQLLATEVAALEHLEHVAEGPVPVIDVDATCRSIEASLRSMLPSEVELFVSLHAGGHVRMRPTDLAHVIMVLTRVPPSDVRAGMGVHLRTQADGETVSISVTVPVQSTSHASLGAHTLDVGRQTAQLLIEASGGSWSTTPTSRGTTHVVGLPRVTEALWSDEDAPLRQARPLRGGRQAHVCVVDDNAHVLRAIQVPLELAGYRVTPFDDPRHAAEWGRTTDTPPDILVTDVVMPVLTGRQLADVFLRLHPELPVLFVSGYTDDVVLRRGVDGSIENLLDKPFVQQDLLARVDRLLEPLRQ